MTNMLKIAAIATVVALSIPSAALARSRHIYQRTDVMFLSVSPSGPTGDPNDAYEGYFRCPELNPHYHGSNGG
ncbi:MAG TPA: hypothetical protein VGJ20_24885 [Xanthobacteraceae bacterium]|jgi:hypothetical protein